MDTENMIRVPVLAVTKGGSIVYASLTVPFGYSEDDLIQEARSRGFGSFKTESMDNLMDI